MTDGWCSAPPAPAPRGEPVLEGDAAVGVQDLQPLDRPAPCQEPGVGDRLLLGAEARQRLVVAVHDVPFAAGRPDEQDLGARQAHDGSVRPGARQRSGTTNQRNSLCVATTPTAKASAAATRSTRSSRYIRATRSSGG